MNNKRKYFTVGVNFLYILFNITAILYLMYFSNFSLTNFEQGTLLEKALSLGVMFSIFLLPIILLFNLMNSSEVNHEKENT
ncbi:hypothetical protein AQ515_19020 [Salmonella enterica]|nr:hypothetical protein [Salmonella enterica]